MSQDQATGERLPKGVTASPGPGTAGGSWPGSAGRGSRSTSGSTSRPAWRRSPSTSPPRRWAGARGRPTRSPGPSSPTPRRSAGSPPSVRRRLGLDPPPARPEEVPPDPEALLTLFEVTIVGFWRDQAARVRPRPGARRRGPAAGRVGPAGLLEPLGRPPEPVRGDRPAGRPAARPGVPPGRPDPGDPRRRRRRRLAGRPVAGPPRRLPRRPGVPRRGPVPLPRAVRGRAEPAARPRASPTGRASWGSTRRSARPGSATPTGPGRSRPTPTPAGPTPSSSGSARPSRKPGTTAGRGGSDDPIRPAAPGPPCRRRRSGGSPGPGSGRSSRVWSTPRQWRMVAWRSWAWTGSSTML